MVRRMALSKACQSHVPQTQSLMQSTFTAETNVEQGMRTSVLGLSSGFGSKLLFLSDIESDMFDEIV